MVSLRCGTGVGNVMYYYALVIFELFTAPEVTAEVEKLYIHIIGHSSFFEKLKTVFRQIFGLVKVCKSNQNADTHKYREYCAQRRFTLPFFG